MLWEEKLIKRQQTSQLTSKPKTNPFDLKDAFYRQAFLEKPDSVKDCIKLDRLQGREEKPQEARNGIDQDILFLQRL